MLSTVSSGLPTRAELERFPDVTAAARGDRQAFTRLVDAYGTTVCSISLAVVRDVAASEDVAQEVFLAIWQKIGLLRDPASFLPWLRQVTRNAARSWLRGSGRRQRRFIASTEIEQAPAAAADAASALELEEERRLLARAIAELPDDAREVVVLFYREGQSIAQVAELLGLREDAIKQRLARARKRLRAELAGKLAQILVRTAPGAAFTATIAGSLTLAAAPSTAAAAGTKAAAGVAKVAGAGVALGGLLGLFGVLGSFRAHWRVARDADERRGLVHAAVMNVAAVLLMTLAVTLAPPAHRLAAGDVALAGFLAFMSWTDLAWLPRHVFARRLAADAGAAARQRQHRRAALVALVLGEAIVLATFVAQVA
jgi:RNA polymerase sigma factor (sigma-70 family)